MSGSRQPTSLEPADGECGRQLPETAMVQPLGNFFQEINIQTQIGWLRFDYSHLLRKLETIHGFRFSACYCVLSTSWLCGSTGR